jgi:hypothetical protein
MGSKLDDILDYVIGAVAFAVAVPLAITQFVNVNSDGWDPILATLFTLLLPMLVMLIGISYIAHKKGGK